MLLVNYAVYFKISILFKGHVGISVPDLKTAVKRIQSLDVKILKNHASKTVRQYGRLDRLVFSNRESKNKVTFI